MLHCPICRVNVAGNKRCCPLCGGALEGEAERGSEVFPVLRRSVFSVRFVQGLTAIAAITVSALCVLINIALKSESWWSLLVVCGSACAWMTSAVAIAHRRDLTQNIAWQVILVSALALLWDRGTGWHGWSFNFVLPCACAAGLCTIPLLAVLLRLPIRSFSGSQVVCSVIGLVPAVLILTDAVTVVLPSLICAGMAILSISVLLLFFWRTVKAELGRRFHL